MLHFSLLNGWYGTVWSHIVGLKKWILSLLMHIFFLHIFLWESSPILGLGHPTKWDKSCFLSYLGRPILHSSPGLKEEEKLKKTSQKCQSWAQGKLKKSSLNQWVALCRGCVWQGGFRNVLYSTLECVLYRGGIKTTLAPLQSSLLQSTANCKKKIFFSKFTVSFIRQGFLVPFCQHLFVDPGKAAPPWHTKKGLVEASNIWSAVTSTTHFSRLG